MKKGTVCRCRCGREYVYTGGRPNPLCPECYRQEKLRRMREYMQEKKRCGDSEKQGAAPAKHARGPKRKTSGKKGARLPMDDTWRRKKKKMDALRDDPLAQLVHELVLVNRERERQGLKPLTYGYYVAEYKR